MAYSDAEKAEALIRLAANRYNFQKTADELGLEVHTLRRWNKSIPKNGVVDLLQRALERVLAAVPENLSGEAWAVTVGILLDKWLLVNGQPTARTENLTRQVNELSDDEYRAAIAEAERIINSAATRGPGGS